MTCAPRGRRLGHRDLLAFDLLLHRGLDARAHVVRVGGRIERLGGLLLDQLLRELQLGVGLTSVFGISMSLIDRTSSA